MNLVKGRNISCKISDSFCIYFDDNFYSTFPWAVINNDEIIVVFRQAGQTSVNAARTGNVTHHDRDSWISMIRSTDKGKTWPKSTYHKLYQSEYGVNDPALMKLSNGDFLLRVTEFDVRPSCDRHLIDGRIIDHRSEHGLVSRVRANVVARYDENLKMQKDAYDVNIPNLTNSCSREPVVELSDGALLLSLYKGAPYETDKVYLVRSFDQGMKWGDDVCLARDKNPLASEYQGINFNETAILPLDKGEILAMARADISFHTDQEFMPVGGVGNLYTLRSFNNGFSWTSPKKTPIFGQPAHLLRLSGKEILCTYGYRQKPYGIRAVFSYDNGETWDMENEIVLRDDGFSWDLGYPMTVQLGTDEFITVYYFNDKSLNRFIAGTRWGQK